MTNAGEGGAFGRWDTDRDDMPVFVFDPVDATAPADGAALIVPEGGVDACWHAIGNAGLTATAHAGGWTTLYATSRGVVRLTGSKSGWGLAGRSLATDGIGTTWGLGHATWTARVGDTRITRRVSAAPGSDPVLCVEVRIEGGAGTTYEERWVPEPLPLLIGALMSGFEPPPPGYGWRERAAWMGLYGLSTGVRAATGAVRRALARSLFRAPEFRPRDRAIVSVPRRAVGAAPPTSPSWFDGSLPSLFVALVDDRGCRAEGSALRVPLGDDEDDVVLRFAVGLAVDASHQARLLEQVRAGDDFTAAAWSAFARLDVAAAPALARETAWHAAQLVSAEQYDDYFGRRYIAQGSAYGFIHGLQGAPRDYALFAVPMAYLDPAAAREQLEVIMRMTKPSGTVFYAHTGRGQCTSGGLHAAPTDLPLFFLWSLTDYVWTTGDAAFLDEPVPFYPAEDGNTATPRERALLALRYIDERVGRGPHGLLRVGSGDWSDPISAMVADRKAFHEHGESGFNTAFAVYALPRVAALLEHEHPEEADAARSLAAELRTAVETTWTGEWFLRGWDGRGAPIGEEHLFLDGQVWCLIGEIGTEAQRATLVQAIAARCDGPSPIGATILDRPHDVRLGMLAPGWDCNGGVWATINALLAWGYAVHDPALAWRSLHKQSFAAHADAYPNIWYGIWSGPDAYNAHFGSHAGETFVQPATPMREFPVMNANAHAGPLLALLRTLGIETDPSGVVVRERGDDVPDWNLTTPLGSFDRAGFRRASS